MNDLKEYYVHLFTHRFKVLNDKINFGLKLNDLDRKLLDIIDEYDYYIDDIIKENKERSSK